MHRSCSEVVKNIPFNQLFNMYLSVLHTSETFLSLFQLMHHLLSILDLSFCSRPKAHCRLAFLCVTRRGSEIKEQWVHGRIGTYFLHVAPVVLSSLNFHSIFHLSSFQQFWKEIVMKMYPHIAPNYAPITFSIRISEKYLRIYLGIYLCIKNY